MCDKLDIENSTRSTHGMQRDPLDSLGLKLCHELTLFTNVHMHSVHWLPLVGDIDSCSEERSGCIQMHAQHCRSIVTTNVHLLENYTWLLRYRYVLALYISHSLTTFCLNC